MGTDCSYNSTSSRQTRKVTGTPIGTLCAASGSSCAASINTLPMCSARSMTGTTWSAAGLLAGFLSRSMAGAKTRRPSETGGPVSATAGAGPGAMLTALSAWAGNGDGASCGLGRELATHGRSPAAGWSARSIGMEGGAATATLVSSKDTTVNNENTLIRLRCAVIWVPPGRSEWWFSR